MSFLFPLYLAGAAAVALPIYLHLRRKPPKEAVDFSSLMFLEPTKHQPLKRRSQLEHVALLVLRCLALLFLAAMFSRPFFAGGEREGGDGMKRTVILLDVSASMRRADIWAGAVERAKDAVPKVGSDAALAIMTIGQAPRVVFEFGDWRAADPAQREDFAWRAIDAIEPGWGGSDLGSGLIAAAELIADASGDETSLPGEIVVVSDLQSGAALDAVAEASWPNELSVVLARVEDDTATNASIAIAASPDPKTPAVRVRNGAESAASEFEIRAGAQTVKAVVPPGESRVFQLANLVPEVVLTGDGDGQDFDNRLFIAPREPAQVKLLFLGSGEPDEPRKA